MAKLLIIFLFCIIALETASALQDPYLVYGYVRYDNGSVVEGAGVNISIPDQTITKTTNSDGKYVGVLENYQDGNTILVTVTKDPYTGSAESILNLASGGITVNVTLHDNISDELTITNITTASGKNYVIDLLDTSRLQYIDRSYTFRSVPSSYADLKYIRTANNDKASTGDFFLEFDINRDVTVYVAHDNRISPKPPWLASFIDTGDNLGGEGGTFSLYSKNFLAGHIVLGGNSGDTNSMYNVVLKPKEEEEIFTNCTVRISANNIAIISCSNNTITLSCQR